MARIDPHGENTMPSPCPVAGGGDQEARCLVGSVPHLRLDSCCGAHAGGRTLLLDFCGEWWISWWILLEFMVDFMAKLTDVIGMDGDFMVISWPFFLI